jgi:hypothetical protein
MVGSSCSGNTPNKRAGTTVLDLKDTKCVNWQTDIVPPATGESSGYWTNTYTNNQLCYGEFVLSHSGYSGYYDGFIFGRNGSTTNYGYHKDSVGSVDWIPHQWGVMAGGGLSSTDPIEVAKGDPYLIAYWGYYSESQGTHSLQVSLADGSLFNPQEVYICNHPWPYWGSRYGDGFARPLNQKGDYFVLYIHGVTEDDETRTIVDTLAVYDPKAADSVRQNPNWHRVDLTPLEEDVKAIYFTMKSTDNYVTDSVDYGPNTAVYFNMDKLAVIKVDGKVAAPAVTTREVKTAAPKAVEVKDTFPIPSYTGGEVTIHDTSGKVVHKTTVKAGEKPNLSKLPVGEYRLRHGHRHIPIKKVK